MLDWFLQQPLWRYDPTGDGIGSITRHFNLFEAACWFGFAGAVLVRWVRYRKTWLECLYAGLFVLFGLSDLREAYVLQPWLIAAKALILVGLLVLRRRLLRTHYPRSRTY